MSSSRPIALITGASSGIGEVFARTLAKRGYDLILTARREERLRQLAAQIESSSRVLVQTPVADLTQEADLNRVAERASREDRLEMLVNNAGFGTVSYFFESDRAEQERMHRLHVTATLVLTHATLPGMVRRDRGSIINVSSVAAFGANPQCVSYNSTKAWMKAFTEGLHLELRLSGSRVRVQALCPGLTYTEFHQTAGLSRDEVYRDGPLWMTPQQVVDASLRGLERGCWLVVPGWRYRVLVFALNHLPRSLWHRLLVSVKRRRSPSLDRRSQNAGRS